MKTPPRLSKKHIDFSIAKIKIVPCDDKLTKAAGLGSVVEAFDESPLKKPFKKCLPRRISNRSQGAYRMALMQMASSIYGHDCLDDLDDFRGDETFEAYLKGEIPSPRTMGDFLRDFKPDNIKKMNEFLAFSSHKIRAQLKKTLPEGKKPGPLVLDIDSTDHIQSAKKMEGLAYNYKDHWCLDSQVVFDDLGFCYDIDLRSGNTKSGVGAEFQIENALKGTHFKDEKHVRADSAYCKQDFFKVCMRFGSKFTVTANDATSGWRGRITEIKEWKLWEYSEEELARFKEKKTTPPKVEVGYFYWQPSWSPSLRLPICVTRKLSEKKKQVSLFEFVDKWDYYAVVCNWNLHLKIPQEVIEFHRKRGNAENFIREEKYGYDLKHFPCQKLMANHAYGQLVMMGHNILRWMALSIKPDKPHFSKKIRRRFIILPGKMVSHARQLTLKIPRRFFKEVEQLKHAWQPQSLALNTT